MRPLIKAVLNQGIQQRAWWPRGAVGLLGLIALMGCSGCTPLDENSSGPRLWLADVPNPFDRDRPRPLARVQHWAKNGKTPKIYVKGEVVKQSPLLTSVIYEIEDGTGSLWIQSEQRDIAIGDMLHVQGILRRRETEVLDFEFSELYLEELRRVE